MALSHEDHKDVSRAFGKRAAGAVSHATKDDYVAKYGASKVNRGGPTDAKNKAIHAKTGKVSPKGQVGHLASAHEKAFGKEMPAHLQKHMSKLLK